MIGNIDHIVDIVSEKNNIDRAIVDKIAKLYFKEWKIRMRVSTEICIPMIGLGKFIASRSKLIGFVKTEIKKLRAVRKRMLLRPETRNELNINREKYYTENIRTAWKQLEAIRAINIQDIELRKAGIIKSFGQGSPKYDAWKKRKQEENDKRISETNS